MLHSSSPLLSLALTRMELMSEGIVKKKSVVLEFESRSLIQLICYPELYGPRRIHILLLDLSFKVCEAVEYINTVPLFFAERTSGCKLSLHGRKKAHAACADILSKAPQ